jgi:acyl-CoA ligase (AMP-forming) (exosortase A-associated)
MSSLVHELVADAADRYPARIALVDGGRSLSYGALSAEVDRVGSLLNQYGVARADRVAIYLEKRLETVIALFGTNRAGGVFVPVNPLLKPEQVAHILIDANAGVLVTTPERLQSLLAVLPKCPDLRAIILIGGMSAERPAGCEIIAWESSASATNKPSVHRVIDGDMAAILYTSGSTGRPKGVVLSHRNLVAGAVSVSHYLENNMEDRILAVLPLSFDYGLSQLTTAFRVGACAVLMNYLLPRDVIQAVKRERITGLAAVPPLWVQLAQLEWPAGITDHLRYFTNSGGHMPGPTLAALRSKLPRTKPYLMYGLTEAFRSTYLPPEEVDRRPDSIGKAIPNAEILVVRADGTSCDPDEPGELVHRGIHVALGYWNDVEKTAERYKPAPGQLPGLPLTEYAVWSGDTVKRDEEGFLYFIGRRDEMIKTSGYRVSPTEVEEVVYASNLVSEVAAIGVDHPTLGQAVVLVTYGVPNDESVGAALMALCKRQLPAFMVPARIVPSTDALPRNPNGKIDRKKLAGDFAELFAESAS